MSSSVIFVAELNRSVDFYCEVLACEATIRSHDAALLVVADGFQIYLIARAAHGSHPSGAIGPQYLIWSVDSAAALRAIERALRNRGRRTYTHTTDGVEFVSGRDPDGIRIVVAHPGPQVHPRSVVDAHLYS